MNNKIIAKWIMFTFMIAQLLAMISFVGKYITTELMIAITGVVIVALSYLILYLRYGKD